MLSARQKNYCEEAIIIQMRITRGPNQNNCRNKEEINLRDMVSNNQSRKELVT